MEARKCTLCNEEKEITEFRKSGFTPNGTQKYKPGCKECRGIIDYIVPVEKECNTCKEIQPINEFPKKGTRTDGLMRYKSQCKSCYYITDRRVGKSKYDKELLSKEEIAIVYNICLNCGKDIKSLKYCSTTCQQDFKYKERVENWKNGYDLGYTGQTCKIKNFVRKYLLNKYNYTCTECTLYDNIGGNTILEVDHIDGKAKNCKEENLRILCPNCHARTPNFRAKNKNSDRIR